MDILVLTFPRIIPDHLNPSYEIKFGFMMEIMRKPWLHS
ncbi:hypothetical protein HMPREF9406_2994 [Clostridium sp. HGF2]|nr:hypothetical protein HMPREF9406_2994 [Clostridium sp. HGF2]EQJ62125.1 hypothetical protein QSI_0876 [Clostridioides difficile P28]